MSSQVINYSYYECSVLIDIIKHTLSNYVNQLQPVSEYRRKTFLHYNKIELLLDPLENFKQGIELLNKHPLIDKLIENSVNKLIYQLKNSLKLIIYIKQPHQSWGILYLILTGNQKFIENIVKICDKKGYNIIDYNLVNNSNIIIPVENEEDLFSYLDIEYIVPENRSY